MKVMYLLKILVPHLQITVFRFTAAQTLISTTYLLMRLKLFSESLLGCLELGRYCRRAVHRDSFILDNKDTNKNSSNAAAASLSAERQVFPSS
jgi:hypothetical protein